MEWEALIQEQLPRIGDMQIHALALRIGQEVV